MRRRRPRSRVVGGVRPARPRRARSSPPGRRGRCRGSSSWSASSACGSTSRDVRGDLLALVADDDQHAAGVEGAGGGQRVAEHAAAGQGVQDLGSRRAHPGSFTCGEDDDGGRAGERHLWVLLADLPGTRAADLVRTVHSTRAQGSLPPRPDPPGASSGAGVNVGGSTGGTRPRRTSQIPGEHGTDGRHDDHGRRAHRPRWHPPAGRRPATRRRTRGGRAGCDQHAGRASSPWIAR